MNCCGPRACRSVAALRAVSKWYVYAGTFHRGEIKTDFSTAVHRQRLISTGKSPKSPKTEDTLLLPFSPFGDIKKQSTSECSSLAVKFDSRKSTAHSRDVLELNLRRPSGSISCAPKTHERKRSSLKLQGGRKATRGHQEYSPRKPGLYGWYRPGLFLC